jgi:hypothetical protein
MLAKISKNFATIYTYPDLFNHAPKDKRTALNVSCDSLFKSADWLHILFSLPVRSHLCRLSFVEYFIISPLIESRTANCKSEEYISLLSYISSHMYSTMCRVFNTVSLNKDLSKWKFSLFCQYIMWTHHSIHRYSLYKYMSSVYVCNSGHVFFITYFHLTVVSINKVPLYLLRLLICICTVVKKSFLRVEGTCPLLDIRTAVITGLFLNWSSALSC